MALPHIDELLASMNQRRKEAIEYRDAALADGDTQTAKGFDTQIAKIEALIIKKGGTVDA